MARTLKAALPRRSSIAALIAGVVGVVTAGKAAGETTIAAPQAEDGWTLYSEGRINSFYEYTMGTAEPVAATHQVQGGGLGGTKEADPMNGDAQGHLNKMRIASGFTGNILGFGLKRRWGTTTVNTFVSIWLHVESEDYRKYQTSTPDAREGYIKLAGPWGSVVAGRALTLFSRGATEINFLYGHGFGLGYPADLLHNGPAAGHIGFGVLANGFAAGVAYATPSIGGFQLTAGVYDPAKLTGSVYERTGLLRPEAEATFDAALGRFGKVHLFVNGEWQKLYKIDSPDSPSESSEGYGAGGRVEVGPLHLGFATHYGHALGLYYALEASHGVYDDENHLRNQGGYYVQAQLALRHFDLNAGWGQTRVIPLASDLEIPAGATDVHASTIKTQTGYSGAVVYHASSWLHFDVDYFRAQFRWTQGEKQDTNTINLGTTIVW